MLEKLREVFAKSSLSHKSSNAYLGVVLQHKEGKQTLEVLGGGPCHGAFSSASLRHKFPNSNSIEFLLSSVQKLLVSHEEAVVYFDWLANRSPWKDVFVTKDPEDIIKKGWVVSTDFPDNLVASALIATRFVTESYTPIILGRYKVYKDILSLGFNELEAFLFSYLFNRKKTSENFPLVFAPVTSGHAVLGVYSPTESYCRNFLLGVAAGAHNESFKKRGGYSNEVTDVWKSPKVPNSSALNTWIKGLRPKDAKAKKNLNIFHKELTSGWEIPNQKAFKSVIEQALERIYNAS